MVTDCSPTANTFRKSTQKLADAAIEILEAEQPMTLRSLYYRAASAGIIPPEQKAYKRIGRVMTRVREAREVPLDWIVDHVRASIKPSSWSGLEDYAESVRRCYRKDLWAAQEYHLEVFVEKDAIAGTIQPVTDEYDVSLNVCRGYASISFAGRIASLWSRIKKPIHVAYVGDFDPSGHDIERDLIAKLERYSGRSRDDDGFTWIRLGVNEEDFETENLLELPVKKSDRRTAAWRRIHGNRCAEIDAIAPTELRRRVRDFIERHIDQHAWGRLQQIERLEKEAMAKVDLGSLCTTGH